MGTGPSSYEKRIYRAAVSQRLRNTDLEHSSLHQAHSSDSRIPLTTELTPFITYNTTHDYEDTSQILKLHSLQHGHILRSTVPTRSRGIRYKLLGLDVKKVTGSQTTLHIFLFYVQSSVHRVIQGHRKRWTGFETAIT